MPFWVRVLKRCGSAGDQDIKGNRFAKVADSLVGCPVEQVHEALDFLHRSLALDGLQEVVANTQFVEDSGPRGEEVAAVDEPVTRGR